MRALFVVVLALAVPILAAERAADQGGRTVKGHPGHKYRPLTDWSSGVVIAKIDPEEVDYFDANYAKVVAISGRADQDNVFFRVRLADQVQKYFDALPANTAELPFGVWFHIYVDVDPASAARERGRPPEAGAELEIQITGSTGSDGSYRLSGWHHWNDTKAADQPAVVKGELDARRNLSYGGDAVEFFIPRAALPARTEDAIRVVLFQNVRVGDREAAILQGTFSLK